MEFKVIMSRDEYNGLVEQIRRLKDDVTACKTAIDAFDADLYHERCRSEHLWTLLNRPAIEESATKGEDEFYAWCADMAEKYEQLDEEEWILDRAKWYNNGRYDLCREIGIRDDEYDDIIAKNYACKEWSTFAVNSGLMDKCNDEETDVLKTEGWSDLPYFYHSNSWIISLALDSIEKRETGANKEKYRKMWLKWYRNHTNDIIGEKEYLR